MTDKTPSLKIKEPPCAECGQPYIPDALRMPIYKAVERILDEHSAWIARPNDEVTRAIAFAATIAAQQIVEELARFDQAEQRREPGTCRCGAAPINVAGLCATCADEAEGGQG